MRARALAGVAVVAALAGCGGQLNPRYCAEHPDDNDCRVGGLVRIDAPLPECTSSADCAGNPAGAVCDTARNKCVECIDDVDDAACTSQMMVCGADQKCHGCVVDSDCSATSMVCLPSQSCAMEASVLYAAPTASGTECSKAMPCTLDTAVEQLTIARHIIKLTTTVSGTDYSAPPIEIDEPFGVQIIGTGTTFTPNAAGDGITASGQNLELLGITLAGAQGHGIACTSGTLSVRRMTVSASTGWGLRTTGCDVTVERSRFSANPLGGMELTSGMHEVRNNIIDRNGNPNLADGNVHIVNASGRFVFNTVALNDSRTGGGGRVSGIKCTAEGSFAIKRNIVAANGPANETIQANTCTAVGNYDTRTIEDVRFQSTSDFRLTAQSPPAAVLDDPAADDDCRIGGVYIDDFQGQPRPHGGYCDLGSDEYQP